MVRDELEADVTRRSRTLNQNKLSERSRSIVSNFIDVRDPIQIVSDRIAEPAGAALV